MIYGDLLWAYYTYTYFLQRSVVSDLLQRYLAVLDCLLVIYLAVYAFLYELGYDFCHLWKRKVFFKGGQQMSYPHMTEKAMKPSDRGVL